MNQLEQLLEDLLARGASPDTLHLVLSRLRESGRSGLVIQQCRKALSLHPNHAGLRTLLAESYLEEGLAARASEELERVTRSLNESARAYRLLADAYARQGRDLDAAGSLDVYLAHVPDDADSLVLRDRLRPPAPEARSEPSFQPRAEDLEAEADEAYPWEEPLPEIATPTLAELYYRQGQIDAAVETYEKILARSPDDARAKARLQELKGLVSAPEEAALEPEIPGTLPEEEPAFEADATEEFPAEETAPFELEAHEEAPLEAAPPEPQVPEALPPEEAALEPEIPGTLPEEEPAFEADATEEFPAEETAFEAETGAQGPLEEPATPPDPERRKTLRMIAVLEQWLTRVQDSEIRPST